MLGQGGIFTHIFPLKTLQKLPAQNQSFKIKQCVSFSMEIKNRKIYLLIFFTYRPLLFFRS
jgi:hypothetical protein